jgi:hypothetical protein
MRQASSPRLSLIITADNLPNGLPNISALETWLQSLVILTMIDSKFCQSVTMGGLVSVLRLPEHFVYCTGDPAFIEPFSIDDVTNSTVATSTHPSQANRATDSYVTVKFSSTISPEWGWTECKAVLGSLS